MDWFSLNIKCTAQFADLAADVLETLGAKGVGIQDQVGEARLLGQIVEGVTPASFPEDLDPSRRVTVSGYYASLSHGKDDVIVAARQMLTQRAEQFEASGFLPARYDLSSETHTDAPWESAWKSGFKRIRVGRHLIVAPPWDLPQSPDAVETVINIDPGMAFGTGTHPTTRMCLTFLEQYVRPGDIVADVGTGSGILAVAAARLGASVVWGWDFDPVAIQCARENIRANRVSTTVRLLLHESRNASTDVPPELHEVMGKCNLVVANIAADTLIRISDMLGRLAKPGGLLIVSGIIVSKEEMCQEEYRRRRFRLVDRLREGEWVSLCFRSGEA